VADHLAYPARVRTADPRFVPSLAAFASGGGTPYELEVEDLVEASHRGDYWPATFRILEDPEDGALIGLCATQPRPLDEDLDAAYIFLVAVNEPFRGWRTPDNKRFGDVLVEDALEQIRERWGGGPMPPVWALVDRANDASHNLFHRHDFGQIDGVGTGYDIRYLTRELP
jgi:ribosomal protein S18 acetylase RimI-like enzyme